MSNKCVKHSNKTNQNNIIQNQNLYERKGDKNMKVYLGDLIKDETIQEWVNKGNRVGIHTTTGSGKTTFINENLTQFLENNGKTGLFLSARTSIVDQNKSNSIFMEYRTIQSVIYDVIIKGEIPSADILIIDEYHHLINDSSFNSEIHALQDVINSLGVATIFISATPPKRNIFQIDTIIDDSLKDMNNPHEYKNVKIYHHLDEIVRVLDNLVNTTNDKIMVYINDSNLIHKLYNMYPDISMVNCSANNSVLDGIKDKQKIFSLLKNQKFNDRILFTTKVIDSGVNIIDEDLKHIIAFSYDVEEVLQVVSRKRDNKNDLNIYLKNYSPKELGGLKSELTRDINILEEFRTNPDKIMRMYINTNRIVNRNLFKLDKDSKFIINPVEEERIKSEYIKLDRLSKNGFIRELEKVNIYGEDMTYKKDWNELEDYLRNHYENGTVWLRRKDRDPLINTINYREDGKIKKSIQKLNEYLELRKSNYRIESFRTTRTIDGKRRNFRNAWKIVKK